MEDNKNNADTKYQNQKFLQLKDFLESKNIKFIEYEKLAFHTSVGVGGRARFFVVVKTQKQLVDLLCYIHQNEIKYHILGNGTNTLASDKLYIGVVISTKNLKRMVLSNGGIYTQCGLGLFEFCKILKENCYEGLEFLYGIPGTIGGAVVMNAGAFGREIGDYIEYVSVYHNGKVKKLSKHQLNFSYRNSIFQYSDLVVLGAKFTLKKGSCEKISQMQQNYFKQKLDEQPYNFPSFGSAFKRCQNVPVGKLIDELGLKGYTIGGAQISKKHAGFIINIGNATCQDFVKMIKYVQKKVFDAYGIKIEPEVKFLE